MKYWFSFFYVHADAEEVYHCMAHRRRASRGSKLP